MTPDHLHATIAIAAMKKGKHAISHKTLSNVLNEVRLAVETEREQKVVTHLLAWLQNAGMYQIRDWIEAGVIGRVREVHNWSNRPVWPQGWLEYPEGQPVPKGLDWDLWLGPVTHRPYHLNYTHALFRGWYDFGAGCLGDMGNYSLWKVYRILGLEAPTTIEAMTSSDARVIDGVSGPYRTEVAFPHASAIRFRHPVRGDKPPVDVFWYDGGIKPMTPSELYDSNEELPAEGMLFVGDEGKILSDFGCGEPLVYPASKRKELSKKEYNDLTSGQDEWIKAIKNGTSSPGSFKEVQTLAEATCLGNLALRLNRRLDWDNEKMMITNVAEANQYLRREYHPGWEL
jgi:predicted dehydrogenase